MGLGGFAHLYNILITIDVDDSVGETFTVLKKAKKNLTKSERKQRK